MRKIIDMPQKSDMGSGWGHYEFAEGITLDEVLTELGNTLKSWGTAIICRDNGDIIRHFDFDLYNNKIFYHHLSGWQYKFIVKKITFSYCFMSEDIKIYVE